MTAFKRVPATIAIVDDHPLVREGIALRLGTYPDFEIVGEAAGEDEGLKLIKNLKPDLAIVDISLRSGDGLSLLSQIKCHSPHTRTLVLSGFQESVYAERSLRAGASGYLNKQESNHNLVDAVRTVLSGKRYISPWLAERLVSLSLDGNAPENDPIDRLTARELEVFRKIGEGMTSGMIADSLIVSKHTVDTHRENIKRKLGLQNAIELTRAAVQWVLRSE
jgi:DNA-binding NarL/FixJ family response regulator